MKNKNENSEIHLELNEGPSIDAMVIEKLLDHIFMLETRLLHIESVTGKALPTGKARKQGVVSLESQIRMLRAELGRVNERAANMRLDRQFIVGAKRIKNKLLPPAQKKQKLSDLEEQRIKDRVKNTAMMTLDTDCAIICGAYPGGNRAYGGQFIKSRMDYYYKNGFTPTIIEASTQTRELIRHKVDGVDVLRVNVAGLQKVLRLSKFRSLGVHSIERPVWNIIKQDVDKVPLFVWVHGFEARAWEELAFNFSEDELETLRPRLENANAERRQTMAEVMAHENAQVIYVSNFMKSIAEEFAESTAVNTHVIPNPVDPQVFPLSEKTAELRKSILWLRSFSANNYASDISRDVLLGLSEKSWFPELKVTVIGQGKYFEEMTEPLRQFSNISIHEDTVDREQMRKLFHSHGVKLVPSRWDSQGLTACEAMHSGLVPLTSSVGGLREYTDTESAVIAELDDAQALIDGYVDLYENPDKYLKMSAAAHEKAAKTCGPVNTTDREIALIKNTLGKKR